MDRPRTPKERFLGSFAVSLLVGVAFVCQIALAFTTSRRPRDRSGERLEKRRTYFEERIKGRGLRLHETRWFRVRPEKGDELEKRGKSEKSERGRLKLDGRTKSGGRP